MDAGLTTNFDDCMNAMSVLAKSGVRNLQVTRCGSKTTLAIRQSNLDVRRLSALSQMFDITLCVGSDGLSFDVLLYRLSDEQEIK